MTDDVFIGIVPSEGSRQPTWQGVFRFDETKGYVGKLIGPHGLKIGNQPFDVPEELNQDALFCLIDGSDFGTIIWPHVQGQRIKNFSSKIIDARFPTLIKKLHIGAQEQSITKVTLISPVFALLFKLRAHNSTVTFDPFKASIETTKKTELNFASKQGTLLVGASGQYHPEILSTKVSTNGYIHIVFKNESTIFSALTLAQQIETFLSLILFAFIKSKEVGITARVEDTNKNSSEVFCEVERALVIEGAQTDIELHEIPIFLSDINFGDVFDDFLEIYESIEQSLNWYRIVVAEDRYLEDKFFYCVRMIESIYKNLQLPTEADVGAMTIIEKICTKIKEDADSCELTKFLKQRVAPIFRRQWTLSAVIRDLKIRYAELRIVEILDEKKINSLRNKEAHGTTQRFSPQEYRFMYYSLEVLKILYVLTILEKCGFDRSFLLASLRKAHRYSRHFNDDNFNSVANDIKQT